MRLADVSTDPFTFAVHLTEIECRICPWTLRTPKYDEALTLYEQHYFAAHGPKGAPNGNLNPVS